MLKIKTYLVTGGAGFIGANFVKYMLNKYGSTIKIIILDKLTYAGNLITLKDELDKVEFIEGDICNKDLVEYIFKKNQIDYIVNFAAESHVDRSIKNPQIFLQTNILGTQNLLEIAKSNWEIGERNYKDGTKFIQVSTDEVYGSLGEEGCFTENTPIDPRSPYSASKVSSDVMVKAYYTTYRLPIIITRCSNNYGPYQYPEKLIPLMINNIIAGKKLPVYGLGKNVRDWIFVKDHVKAIDMVISKGIIGDIYNIGSHNEKENIEVVKLIIDIIKNLVKNEKYKEILNTSISNINYELITFVKDRLGHDLRYAIDSSKIEKEIGWKPEVSFEEGLLKTVEWYLNNQDWIKRILNDGAKY